MERFATTIWLTPNRPSCFQNWVRPGVLEKILRALAQHLKEAGELDLSECFVDGTSVPAKKGGAVWDDQAGQRHQNHGVTQTHSYKPKVKEAIEAQGDGTTDAYITNNDFTTSWAI